MFRLDVDLLLPEHLDAGVDEERAEDVDNPMKTVDQRRADEDHRQTHEQRAHHAPEKHAMLELAGYFEVSEDQQEDEQVID